MNFFFSIKNSLFNSKLTIPKFTNESINLSTKVKLYSLEIKNNKWHIKREFPNNAENFFYINNKLSSNSKIFFLSFKKEKKIIDRLKLFDSFTDTSPAFRANFLLNNNKGGGFTSYQSEYPYEMTLKNGCIISPINFLLDKKNDKNYIIFRNIFFKPVKLLKYIYFIDYNNKEVKLKLGIFSNYTNFIKVPKKLIKKDIYFVSNDLLGIPIFLSINKQHMSLEHTHPAILYLMGKDKFEKIKNMKESFLKIILDYEKSN
jgi:hypothetical protein